MSFHFIILRAGVCKVHNDTQCISYNTEKEASYRHSHITFRKKKKRNFTHASINSSISLSIIHSKNHLLRTYSMSSPKLHLVSTPGALKSFRSNYLSSSSFMPISTFCCLQRCVKKDAEVISRFRGREWHYRL